MAADLIFDLGLDQEQHLGSLSGDSACPTEEQLSGIRTYLGFTYLVSTLVLPLPDSSTSTPFSATTDGRDRGK